MIDKPELMLPAEEADWLRQAYGRAGSILEYGSGGSTAMAASMSGKVIHTVESDPEWAKSMRAWITTHPGLSPVIVHHVPLGPTTEWGMPEGPKGWRNFSRYPLGIWDEKGVDPDVVLVDGRFRVGCVLATLFRSPKPVTLYFDDYTTREKYRAVEEFIRPTEIRGRMARFEIEPRGIEAENLLRIMELIQRPI
ncbi:hypothetical protein SAMN05421688_3221 [Poseidonocella pacifica]|uniref:Class I SAM-dependent methyltransferase n=1 Tax=Poseidonocella pacifica TaxID=871651 RepID=A0A1I0YMK6_9RHOB|nr:hypothetical protein SAMN05421688_3221 [Poseidonocella pacifica]